MTCSFGVLAMVLNPEDVLNTILLEPAVNLTLAGVYA
jgi:hypothetical protein